MLEIEDIARLYAEHRDAVAVDVRTFEIRGRTFAPFPNVGLMGVINLSPDSTHRESVSLSTEAAIRRGRRLAADGAQLVDVGAESSIRGREKVAPERQRDRLLPVVEALANEGVVVSVETYDLETARACLEAGAGVLNLTATTRTEAFYRLVAEHDAGCVVCYIQGETSRGTSDLRIGDDHVGTLRDHFARETDLAERCGVSRLWIDPGLGFSYGNLADEGVRVRYLMNSLLTAFRLRSLGWPVLQQPPSAFDNFEDEVRCGEPFFAVLATLGKVDVIRTHEVAKVRGVVKTLSAYES